MNRMERSLRSDSEFLEEMAEQKLEEARCPGGYSAKILAELPKPCLLYTSPSPRD